MASIHNADIVADESGLYGKYVVFKQGDDGLEGPLDGCFVLRPDHDPAARKALSAYANADGVHGSPLARSLREWLWALRQIDGSQDGHTDVQ